MKLKFQQKLFLGSMIAVLFAIIPLFIFISYNLKSWIWQRTELSLKKQLVLLKDIAEVKISTPLEIEETDAFVDNLSEKLGIRITLIEEKGRVLGDSEYSGANLLAMENHLLRPEVKQIKFNDFGKSIRYSTTTKTNFLYMAIPIYIEGKSPAILRASIPLSDINTLISNTQNILLVGALISTIIAMLLSLFISRRISYPVKVMTRIANKMAGKDFSEKIKIQTKDEHSELAASLNKMSDELEHHIHALISANSELNATLSGMEEGLLVTNEKAEIILFNLACEKLFGIQNIPKSCSVLDATHHVSLNDAIREVLHSSKTKNIEITKDPFILSANISPLKHPDETKGVVCVFYDITNLRRIERMRRDFVANVSHELKTPLTSIKGFSETLLDLETLDQKQLRNNIEIIHKQANQLESLIMDLLDLSAIESGEIRMKKEPIQVKSIFQNIITELSNKAKEKKLTVTYSIKEDDLIFTGDPRWIKQAVLNLVLNAYSYTNHDGTISLTARKENKNVILEIKDTGIGIAKNDLTRIFERFYRTDKARSRIHGGTGLGLAIVKHIAEAHNGKVFASSEIEKSSTFTLSFPIS